MDRIGGEDVGQRTSINQVALSGLIGATVEWYDFFLYGTAAALVFGQLFFPSSDPLVGTIAAFGSFAFGYLSRPIGAVVFGHYGDKIGRKAMLILTLLIMGIATFLIGLLPTYDTIGVWAPILLLVLRFFQGIGLGGEWGGAVLLAVEHSPRNKRGFYGSLIQIGAPAGLLLGTGAFLIVSNLPEEQFLSWGWRLPFLVSVLLIGVGLFIRLKILETPAFSQVKESGTEARMPMVEVFRDYPKNVLLTMGARLSEGQVFNIFAVFAITYATTQLELTRSTVLYGVLIGAAVECLTLPVFGAFADRFGRRPVYMGGAAFCALFAFPFFWLLDTENTVLIWLALALGFAIGHSAMWGPQASFFSEAFGTRVRYSGTSFVYQFSGIASSALTPLIATALLGWAGGSPWLVVVFVIVYAAISFISTYLARETYRDEISEVRADRQPAATGEPA
jgi:MFS transporter, MHS family, shikimate and dehydroshikimate transport protein